MNEVNQTSKSKQVRKALASGPVKAQLKAERVQQMLLLRGLHAWKTANEGTAIQRVRQFAGPAEAGAFVGFVSLLAAGQRQPVTIGFAGKRVEITLTGHPVRGFAGGLTNAVFDLATMLG